MSTNKAQLKEALSAFIDGEATDIEVRRLLKEMPFDHTLRDSWRYHQLSSAIINKELSTEIVDFSADISSAIKLEKNHGTLSFSNYFIKPLGRFAIHHPLQVRIKYNSILPLLVCVHLLNLVYHLYLHEM